MSTVFLDRSAWDAVIFDMDGVLTRTEQLHEAAWKHVFDEHLVRHGDERPFVREDYLRYVDGKSRSDGIRAFLRSRGIHATDTLVDVIAHEKNRQFFGALERHGVHTYADAQTLLGALEQAGFELAVISASRNCAEVLRRAELDTRFSAVVDGRMATRLGLAGKPAPDVFLEAARRLGTTPARSVVIEDSEAGVSGARHGGFSLVVGVDRGGHAAALLASGANVVVSDLRQLMVRNTWPWHEPDHAFPFNR